MVNKRCFSFVLLSLIHILTISEQKAISPDSKRLYHDIVSGHGLYYGFDKFEELNNTTFKNMVFNKSTPKLWLVEFYNSWCGHCHRFAPTWKALAADIYGWRHLVALTAVDCSKDQNNQLCRDFEVMYYPMIKLFPPLSSDSFLGNEFSKGSIGAMRRGIINQLRTMQGDQTVLTKPNLRPYNGDSLEGLWTDIPMEVLYTVIIIEPNESYICSELAMDFSRAQELQIRCVSKDNKALGDIVGFNTEETSVSLFAIKRDLQVQSLEINNNTDRITMIKNIKDFFNNKGIVLTVEFPSVDVGSGSDVDISDVMSVMQWEDEIKKKLNTNQLSSIVFQLDLEGAVRYSLKNEIPLHKNITGEALVALKNYVNVLVKYFPIGKQGVKLFTRIKDEVIGNKSEVKGKDFRESVKKFEEELHPIFLPNQGWLGCRGSKMEYRGYPCSLWTMFHTLTVSAGIHNSQQQRDTKGSEVLDAMTGYVKYFFSCSDCSQHFQQMAVTISNNVTTYEDSILWLWASHNKVNARLAGDQTEDPEHRKVQFPTIEACPQCRDESGQFKSDMVLQFLKSMYSNISYLQIDAMSTAKKVDDVKYSKNLKNEHVGLDNGFDTKTLVNKSKRLSWDFNIFDISLCVFLYICSVAILIVVCIKFVFKRTYRKKTYVFDLLSKV